MKLKTIPIFASIECQNTIERNALIQQMRERGISVNFEKNDINGNTFLFLGNTYHFTRGIEKPTNLFSDFIIPEKEYSISIPLKEIKPGMCFKCNTPEEKQSVIDQMKARNIALREESNHATSNVFYMSTNCYYFTDKIHTSMNISDLYETSNKAKMTLQEIMTFSEVVKELAFKKLETLDKHINADDYFTNRGVSIQDVNEKDDNQFENMERD